MLKRPIVIGAVLFFAGVIISVYGLTKSIIFALIIAACAAVLSERKPVIICTMAVLIVLLGAARMDFAQKHLSSIVSEYAGKSYVIKLTATDFSENNKVIAQMCDSKRKIRVYLSVKSNVELSPGDIVEGEVTLRAPLESKTQLNSFANYLAAGGVYLQASAESVRITGRVTKGITGKLYSLRTYMDKLGDRFFSGNSRALFNAMIFGDKRLISSELDGALRGSGLNHIAVVSGMHLSVMIAMEMFVIQKIFGKRRIGYIFAVLGAAFITVVTGAGASVIRALIMCSLFQLSRLLYRENDILTSLFFAAIMMIGINPYIIFNPGFILSVLSVLGIALYNEKICCFLKSFLPVSVAEAASLSISAQLTLTPALVYYFGILTPYALLSNLPAVTLSGVYVVAGMVFVVLSPFQPLAQITAPVINAMAAGIESVCFKIAALPQASMEFGGNFAFFSAAWVFLLVLVYIYPAPIRRFYRTALCFCLVSALAMNVHSGEGADIEFFVCGGETLAAVEISGDSSFLIDCPDIYDALTLENSQHPFEYAIMTRSDTGEALSEKSNIDKIIVPDALFDEKAKYRLCKQAEDAGTRVIFKKDYGKFQIGSAVVEYLPLEEIEDGRAVKIEYGGKTLVTLQGFTGNDIENLLGKGICIPCDYLRLPFAAVAEGHNLKALCTGKIITDKRIALGK